MSPPVALCLKTLPWRLRGKPIAEYLFLGEADPPHNVCVYLVDLLMFFKVGYRKFDAASCFVGDEPAQFRFQARTVLDAPLSLHTCKADRAPPSVSRLDRGRILQLD